MKWKIHVKSQLVTSFEKSGANSLNANIYHVKLIEIVKTIVSLERYKYQCHC